MYLHYDETLSAGLTLEDSSLSSVIELVLMSSAITIIDSNCEQHISFQAKFAFHVHLNVKKVYDTTLSIDNLSSQCRKYMQ